MRFSPHHKNSFLRKAQKSNFGIIWLKKTPESDSLVAKWIFTNQSSAGDRDIFDQFRSIRNRFSLWNEKMKLILKF